MIFCFQLDLFLLPSRSITLEAASCLLPLLSPTPVALDQFLQQANRGSLLQLARSPLSSGQPHVGHIILLGNVQCAFEATEASPAWEVPLATAKPRSCHRVGCYPSYPSSKPLYQPSSSMTAAGLCMLQVEDIFSSPTFAMLSGPQQTSHWATVSCLCQRSQIFIDWKDGPEKVFTVCEKF